MNANVRNLLCASACLLLACNQTGLRDLEAKPGLECEVGAALIACTTLDFGDVPIGATVVRNLALTNTGNALLTVSGAGFDPGSDPAFKDQLSLQTVAIGKSGAFTITFTPAKIGPTTASFFVAVEGGKTTRVSLTIIGNGTGAAQPQLVTCGVDFGNVAQGTTATQTVSLNNLGNVPMVLASPTTSSAVFGVTPPSAAIPPGGSAPITITYTPPHKEQDTGAATLLWTSQGDTTDEPQPINVQLIGESEPQILVTPTMVTFPNAMAASTTMQTVTVTNVGEADLQLTSAALNMASSPFFSVSGATTPLTIVPGGGQPLVIAYDTTGDTGITADTGTLVIASDDPMTPMVNVTISGACPTCNQPDPGCNMTYPHRVWPSGADVSSCTEGNGPLNTTGSGAEDWLDYAGCGNQRDFTTTPGQQISIMSWGDACGCPGCVLWHIDYDLEEQSSGNFAVTDTVTVPDADGCPNGIGVNNTTNYTATTTDVRLVGEQGTTGEGFYFTVCSK